MYRQGHHGLNALLYAPVMTVVSFLYGVELGIIGAVVFVGLSSAPDIDRHFDSNMNSYRSDVWHLVPISHRGFTHTVWFALVTGAVCAGLVIVMAETYISGVAPAPVLGGFGFLSGFGGVVGHLLGDVATPAGIAPFSPLIGKNYSLQLFKAANMFVNYGVLIIGVAALSAALGVSVSEFGFATESLASSTT